MTGSSSEIFYNGILPSVQRPGRYIGGELNLLSAGFREGDYNLLLAFPDVYELGMSYQGIHSLARHLSPLEGVNFEFMFAPWPDLEEFLIKCGLPLISPETGTPAARFDLVGFSLTYELHYTNMIRMLRLAGIPLESSARSEDHPLVIAGGPCVMNPLPVLKGLDAVFLGDGEESLPQAVELLRDSKEEKTGRSGLKKKLAGIEGVYVEGFSGSAEARKYSMERVDRCSPPYTLPGIESGWKPAVPPTGIVHDRLIVEVQRGCTRGCRFCQAGILYRPCRERTAADVTSSVLEGIEASGWEEVSLLSLSTSDYSKLEELAEVLAPGLRERNVSLAMPSLRPGTVTGRMIEVLSQGKRSGFTIAPEAGTERLRQVINKSITGREIIDCCRKILQSGWRTLKLYFMIGLPTETEKDLEGIVGLIERVLEIKRNMKLNVTISPFVPKSHTPFQWEKQSGIEEIREKEEFLSSRLNDRRLSLQLRNPEVSILEGILARGEEELWPALIEAVQMGAKFEGWTEHFNFSIWEKALSGSGIEPDRLISARDPDKRPPWSRFSTGVSGRFLRREREKAYREELTPDCREGECSGCGVCGPVLSGDEVRVSGGAESRDKPVKMKSPDDSFSGEEEDTEPVYFRYRCLFSKTGKIRFVSHRDLVDVLRRALKRTGLPVCYSKGFHPQSRISVSPPLAVGMEGENEFFDIKLWEQADFSPEAFRPLLPAGLSVTSCTGPFSRRKGKLPPEALFHYYLDFSLIRGIIESMGASGGRNPRMEKYFLLGRALGLEESMGLVSGMTDPAALLGDKMKSLLDQQGKITDRRGRERPTMGSRTGEVEGDLLELFLEAKNGVGVTPRDLLGIYLPENLVPLVKVNRKGIYYRRGGEYLNPVELIS
ncbi:MAG: TIGR03960 family B12-binding radical SAM protein [Candidatus Krumholzibacteriales bacterium]